MRIALTGVTGLLGRNLLFEFIRQHEHDLDNLEIFILGRNGREKSLLVERSWDVEFRERADTEVGELIVDESRESERSKH